MKIQIFLLSVTFTGAWLSAAEPRTKENFDHDWRFARFGLMADGTRTAEPGATTEWTIPAKASSEEMESGREHPAAHAMDGDASTRWCASDGKPSQWLQLDFGKPQSLKEIRIQWDVTDTWKGAKLPYGFVIEGSSDGNHWKTMADHDKTVNANPSVAALNGSPRYLRVRSTRVEGSQWASIREIELKDGEGKALVNSLKPAGQSPADPAFADEGWRKLSVPHDWGIEGPFRLELEGNTGKLPWRGIGWYRKHFTTPQAAAGKRVVVRFEGVYRNSEVWLNGVSLGSRPYGYINFDYDLTPHLAPPGQANVLAVKVAGFNAAYESFDMPPEAQAALKPGKNVMAVHCHQTEGGQYIDVGIVTATRK
jgi:beta-galactosidase